jgi:hypothetical protein
MFYKQLFLALCILVASVWIPGNLFGGDLDDDGISKYTEDPITKYSELGKKDRNISYIVMEAKSKAKMKAKNKDEDGKKESAWNNTGDKNDNSIVFGAGANVNGDVILIVEDKFGGGLKGK